MTDQTALDAVKAAYPSQYYGTIVDGKIQSFMDVWNGLDIAGAPVNVLTLGAASTMAALTSGQWELAQVPSVSGMLNVFTSGTAIQYGSRFYCDSNSPCSVYDMWGFLSVTGEPSESTLHAITASEYADRQKNPRSQYFDTSTNTLQDYTPAPVAVPLKTQAATAQAWIQQQANLAAAMGEAFTADMKAYVKAVNAIASGADTTSTALPAQPADILTS
ncbi:hypothetical protein [Acetobacter okinawensis]|uniref:Uncharacterized protein n=1 Tax=Acetobacter okinawensis TaxID=1076594 RepID=A0A252BYE0_9PROT|nr:hypothetical protein [Acetobacter okinawensis]OUJ13811.1 hypothetical protein HK26_03945 [Acetobacter okinawensis]